MSSLSILPVSASNTKETGEHVDYYLRSTCRMCDGHELSRVMELIPTPPGNNFLTEDEINKSEPSYPLELYFCSTCYHIQLGHIVDPRILYQNNYPYVSATSSQFVNHLRAYADRSVERYGLRKGDLVADIGSNDGTCLKFFKDHGMRVLGIDPAINIAETATTEGIETIGMFFSFSLAQQLREKHGPATLITSHNACAHIDQLDDVILGVSHWLQDDGIFVVEVGYFVDVYAKLWFDTIYHEHLDYHTVGPFGKLFDRMGMEIVSVERTNAQGGSIRITVQKKDGLLKKDASAEELICLEKKLELNKRVAFIKFIQRINKAGENLRNLLQKIKMDGKSIAAYGATTKSTTLLSQFQIDREFIDFIADDNPLKQGLFSPRLHIPVLSADELYRRSPDYVLLLAWNFAEPIMKTHRAFEERGGRFILPMPEPRIV